MRTEAKKINSNYLLLHEGNNGRTKFIYKFANMENMDSNSRLNKTEVEEEEKRVKRSEQKDNREQKTSIRNVNKLIREYVGMTTIFDVTSDVQFKNEGKNAEESEHCKYNKN